MCALRAHINRTLYKLKITMGWEDLIMKILKSTLDFWVAFFVCVANLPCVGLSINEHRTKVVGLGLIFWNSNALCHQNYTIHVLISILILQHFLIHTYFYNFFFLIWFTIFFYPYRFSQYLNNIIRNFLPNNT